MLHLDMGHRGSELTIEHPPLRNQTLFIGLLSILVTTAFSFGLHLLDKKSLVELVLLLSVCCLLKLSYKIHSERVLLLPSLGVQLESHYCLGHVSTNFLDLSQVKDIFITEAVTMHSVLTYMVVCLNDEACVEQQPLFPLFGHSWPPISDLKYVYRVTQHKLFSRQTM